MYKPTTCTEEVLTCKALWPDDRDPSQMFLLASLDFREGSEERWFLAPVRSDSRVDCVSLYGSLHDDLRIHNRLYYMVFKCMDECFVL